MQNQVLTCCRRECRRSEKAAKQEPLGALLEPVLLVLPALELVVALGLLQGQVQSGFVHLPGPESGSSAPSNLQQAVRLAMLGWLRNVSMVFRKLRNKSSLCNKNPGPLLLGLFSGP